MEVLTVKQSQSKAVLYFSAHPQVAMCFGWIAKVVRDLRFLIESASCWGVLGFRDDLLLASLMQNRV